MEINWTVDPVAVYGAATATGVMVWNIRRARRETPHVKVTAEYHHHLAMGGDLLSIHVLNRRRPVRVRTTQAWGKKRRWDIPFRQIELSPVFQKLVPAQSPVEVDWVSTNERHELQFVVRREDPVREVLRTGVVFRVLTEDGHAFASRRYVFREAAPTVWPKS